MYCQDCGSDGAFIHLTEIIGEDVQSVWLCPTCSRLRQETSLGRRDQASPLGKDSDSLASFLGEGNPEGGKDRVVECPACSYTLAQWRQTNLLACPLCYQAFREVIVPHLRRFHGNASHLGKIPKGSLGVSIPSANLNRLRLALEKAVAREDFEEAARIRDDLSQLKSPKEGGS